MPYSLIETITIATEATNNTQTATSLIINTFLKDGIENGRASKIYAIVLQKKSAILSGLKCCGTSLEKLADGKPNRSKRIKTNNTLKPCNSDEFFRKQTANTVIV